MALRMPAKIRYGIRILIEIGRNREGALPLTGVEKRQKISAKFAKQILQPLMRAGLVDSIRGLKGGYRLLKAPEAISLHDIVRVLSDKNDRIAPCLVRGGSCRRESTCGVKSKWCELQSLIDGFLAETTLQDVMDAKPAPKPKRRG